MYSSPMGAYGLRHPDVREFAMKTRRIGWRTVATGLLGMVAIAGVVIGGFVAANTAGTAAAGKQQQPSPPAVAVMDTAEPTPTAGPLDRSVRRVPAAAFERLRASASPDEWALIEDGVLTRAEIEAAFVAADVCTRSAAAQIGGVILGPTPMFDPDGAIRFAPGRSESKTALDAVGDAHQRCVGRYFDDVLAAWDMERTHTAYQPLWDRIADCLATRGYAAKHGMDRRQLAETVGRPGDAIPDFFDCEASASQPAAPED
jgi:hypothetical protein